ncbi:MAG: hypothetical protein GY898_28390 [Proteobacteria bacterium]|nr:hypothetical protein [Pseudomonadota bacterium]
MGRLPFAAVLSAAILAGCAALPPVGGPAYDSPAPSVLPGDLLVAADRGGRHTVTRFRSTRAHDGGGRLQASPLLTLEATVRSVAASTDGRWLAAAHDGDGKRIALFDLSGAEPTEVWTSPPGCGEPAFHPASTLLVAACAAAGDQPEHLLQLTLKDRTELALVGERPRRHPAFGIDGDLYWAEPAADRTRVVRRAADRLPYRTHEVVQPIRDLWPQQDGSVIAEFAVPGTRREFVQLLASGVVRDTAGPYLHQRAPSRDAPLVASASGHWFLPVCERGPCFLVKTGPDWGSALPLALTGTPTAIGRVLEVGGAVPHPEDLATAPAAVLSSHSSTTVAVLGVELGTALETAFSTLDRAGRHPYWIEGRGLRDKPRGIGLGWSTDGHCIEYLADERGVIATVDLRSCAGHYLSPTLRPLLDRQALANDGGLELARRYLGPGVAVTVGGADDLPRGTTPILRTEVVYTAPERGYHYEAHAEMLQSGRTRLLGGTVWLRLQLPGRRTAAVRP